MDDLLEATAYLLDARTGRRVHRRPHHRWEHRYRRRCRRYGVTPVVVSFTAEELYAAYGRLCWWCGREAGEIDHVQAVIEGGEHTLANVRPCCHECNAHREAQRRRRARSTPIPGQLMLEVPGAVLTCAPAAGSAARPAPRPPRPRPRTGAR